jgi:hypothetical protein
LNIEPNNNKRRKETRRKVRLKKAIYEKYESLRV